MLCRNECFFKDWYQYSLKVHVFSYKVIVEKKGKRMELKCKKFQAINLTNLDIELALKSLLRFVGFE